MRRLLQFALVVAAFCLPASAQYQRAFGWCEQGGQRSVTNGVQSSTRVQASYAACTVTVFEGGTTTPAAIFSDSAHTQTLANPFTATSTGFWAFYANDGTYDVQFSGAGITSPFSIAGYKLGSGSSGGGGTVGPGTVNNLSKFITPTNVGDATCTDDGITPMSCGLGVNLATSALFAVKSNNGATGTTANLLIARDAAGLAINAQPTDTNNVIGVAGYGAGTTGAVSIAYSGQFPCRFDNQTAIGDWVTLGSNSRCHDAGATEPSGVENMGRVNSVNAGSGTLAGVDWGFPDSTNTSAGGGTGVVGTCATAGAEAYYPATGNTIGCDPALRTDGAGNVTAASVSTTGSNAGYFASQQGSAPTLTLPNANYLYGDTAITTTFGTVMPSTPGSLNQVLAVTSVPDATHIKLGYVSPATGAGGLNTQVQYNDAGSFNGDAGFTFNKTNQVASAYYMATSHGPWVDPRAAPYNCVGDGTTDDTACFQTALNYAVANHGAVLCSGSYKLDRIQISSNSWIEGTNNNNAKGCRIFVKTDAAFVSVAPVTNFLGSVTFRNIQFIGGSNPIDLPYINASMYENLSFFNQTGCAISLVFGEQRILRNINSTHTGNNGFAVLCTGDRTKSLFSASLTPGFGGADRMIVEQLVEQGNINAGVGNYNSWLWWHFNGGIDDSRISNLICFFSCVTGLWQVGDNTGDLVLFNTLVSTIDLDHIGLSVGSPASVAVNIQGSVQNSLITNYDPDHNTNYVNTQMFVDDCANATLMNMRFGGPSHGIDNVTKFGLSFGNHSGTSCNLIGISGGLYTTSGNNFKNMLSTLSGNFGPSNFNSGGQLNDYQNSGVQITLANNTAGGNNTTAATSLFKVTRGVGDGTTWTSDFTSDGTLLSLNEKVGYGKMLIGNHSPTISSGFGTSPAMAGNNGQTTFRVNVGTGGTATSGVIAMNDTATTGWNCAVNDLTAAAAHVAYNTRQTASSTTTVTVENQTTSTGAAIAWAASDILTLNCFAF